MTDAVDCLIELGTEELPPKALLRLSQAFAEQMRAQLSQAELSHEKIKPYASPRRLALVIEGLATRQQDKTVERRGPALQAALDKDGQPTKAALGFARSCGVAFDQLEQRQTDKGTWLYYQSEQAGQATAALLPEMVQKSLDALPIPKRMRWGAGSDEFVRPVHWLIILLGGDVVPATILGANSDRLSRGHRFHHPDTVAIKHAGDYARVLEDQAQVIADFDTRRDTIRRQVEQLAKQKGGVAVIDEDLLDEVTAMVEWPVALLGDFEADFLNVPAEALVSAMKNHQKYFHVLDGQGGLLPHFITVSNVDSNNMDTVRRGNERVIRPRLADAKFFWDQDRKQPLANRQENLGQVVFQKKLGTLADKAVRLSTLTQFIAQALGADVQLATRAAQLCKCDLMTDMVGEFPELQGIMGRYYASHDDEPEEVAQAIEQHYQPRFAGDLIPAGATGRSVALADKLDTLVGIFGIGQPPSGDKDPFALRRAALGLIRIMIEGDLDLDLAPLMEQAIAAYAKQGVKLVPDTATAVVDFILSRLPVYYANQGYQPDEIEAVVSLRPTRLSDLDRRLKALALFRKLEAAASLSAANKRISNILKKSDQAIPTATEAKLFAQDAENDLATAVDQARAQVTPLFDAGDYSNALTQLATLRAPVDRFFDEVMVMDEDPAVRANRLALLKQMQGLFLRVADLSCLQS